MCAASGMFLLKWREVTAAGMNPERGSIVAARPPSQSGPPSQRCVRPPDPHSLARRKLPGRPRGRGLRPGSEGGRRTLSKDGGQEGFCACAPAFAGGRSYTPEVEV